MKNLLKRENQIVRINRRELLALGATGAIALAGFHSRGGAAVFGLEHNAAADTTTTLQSTPALEEGPYWVEELLNRSDVRSDPTTGVVQEGLPLFLSITVSSLASDAITPLENAFVDIWLANAEGVYSDESSESTTGDKYLRGYQVSDANGHVHFLAIYPGWYSGRTVHVHARVRIFPNNDTTQTPTYNYLTQLFFDDDETDKVFSAVAPYSTRNNRDTTNTTDRVLNGASLDSTVTTEAGDYTILRVAEDLSHATATFHMILDLTNTYDISANDSTTTTGGTTATTTTTGGTTGGGGGTAGGPGGGTSGGGTPPSTGG